MTTLLLVEDDARIREASHLSLRGKVEPDPGQPTHVVTVRGVGYRAGRP
jgi:two-component system, OmpR family, response regulator MtrA